jgi:hypothetical protein
VSCIRVNTHTHTQAHRCPGGCVCERGAGGGGPRTRAHRRQCSGMCSASVLSALYLSPYCEGISHFFILVVSAVAAAGTLVVCMHVRVAYFALGLLAALFFVQAFGLQVGLFFLLQHLYFRVLCSAGACASGGLGGDAANRALFRYQCVSEVAWVGLLVVYSLYLLSPAEEQMLCLQVWRWHEFARAPPSGSDAVAALLTSTHELFIEPPASQCSVVRSLVSLLWD